MPHSFGHKAGVGPIRDITQACLAAGVKILTWYVFSTENWSRDQEEVSFLMKLFTSFFKEWREEISSNNIQMRHLGFKNNLPKELVQEIELTEAKTINNNGMVVNIALNYGGKSEIVNATRIILNDD